MLDYEILNKDNDEELDVSADISTEGAEPLEEELDEVELDDEPEDLDEEDDDDMGYGKDEM